MEKPYQATPDIDVLPAFHPVPGIGVLPVNAFVIKAKPESTEGRPWGQPLKKPAGAPLNLG